MRGPAATVGLVVAFTVGAARADEAETFRQGVRIDALQPASPDSPFFRVEGPHAPSESVEFAFRVGVDEGTNEVRQVVVDSAGNGTRVATIVKNALLLRVAGSITPVHWLSLEVGQPFALAESGQPPGVFAGAKPVALHGPGAGDPHVGLHVRPIDSEAFGLLFGGRVWGPFGSESTYLSDGRFRAEVDLAAFGEAPAWLWGATANVAPGFFAGRDGDRVALSIALYRKLAPFVSIGVEPAFELLQNGVESADTLDLATHTLVARAPQSRLQALFEPVAGVRFKLGFLRFGVAAGGGVGAAGAASLRVLGDVGVVFEGKRGPPPPVQRPDRDLDGVPDDEDACPDAAGPRSSDPKKNGCPQVDRDADGVPDDEDACPDAPGIRHPDPKANGCPDSDNDGIPDPIDPCPNEPGKGGCPKYARLAGEAFKITPPIDFSYGDSLNEKGRAALAEVAATAHANPKTIDQISIGIGTKGARQALSDKRAEVVLSIMHAQALATDRYEVVQRDDLPAGKVVVRIIKK